MTAVISRAWAGCLILSLLAWLPAAAAEPKVEPWRVKLRDEWRKLPAPPITPYHGPFGDDGRAFVGKVENRNPAFKGYHAFRKEPTPYDPAADPRPINTAFEQAMLEDWRRMGYNCSYKGGSMTWRVGRFLKANGLLGAIDQTLWGNNGPPPLAFDGSEGPRQREGCGSFFAPENHQAGVEVLSSFATHYGDADMFKVGDVYITCSWDEVGMRTRSMIDYRPEAIVEYRRYLRDVWFGDESPGKDTNSDGRTYNQFTGESLSSWDEVEPPRLTPKFYTNPTPDDSRQIFGRPGAYKLWLDFQRYYTFEFFRRVNQDATAKAGRRIECYPFPQAFIMWPGMNAFWSMGTYWNARLNPILNVEQCWPDSPTMAVNYAINDRLARKFDNLVMGWTWFYFGKEGADMYNGPYDNGRALARMMGHRVDGIHHWLYSPIYRGRDQHQRLQIGYWHNFLAHHYPSFLARSEPVRPQVALLMPDYTGYFYRMFNYPKFDWAYTAQALQEAQIAYEIITEEELELDPQALDDYKLLYVVGSEWTTPTIRRRVTDFIAQGGHVCANVDSLSLDIPTGRRTDFVEKTFGARITRKYKNSFLPTTQTAAEQAWAEELNGWGKPFWLQGHSVHKRGEPGSYAALWKLVEGRFVRNDEVWSRLDELMARMPREVHGIRQSPLDMRDPPKIKYAEAVGPAEPLVTWNEVNVAEAVGGEPIAWLGDEVCGVETERTVWLGMRTGGSLHAIAPRMTMHRTTEPCNPYVNEQPELYEAHRPYVEVLAYAAKKAGVARLVTATLDDRVVCNLEVLPRVDEQGNLMVIVVNHDSTDATYQVTIDPEHLARPELTGAQAWDLLRGELIEENTDGRFELKVEPEKVAVFLVGHAASLAPIIVAQARLAAMDLSVPQYFRDRPELNEYEWATPVPPLE